MKPAMIATDLDGTFLGANAEPHPMNMMAARRAIEEGVVFVVATGRPRRWLDEISELADLNPMVISSNGAAAGPLAAPRPDFLHHVDPDRVLAFAAAMPDELEVSYALEYERDWGREPNYPAGHLSSAHHIAPLAELLDRAPAIKVLARTRHADTAVFAPVALEGARGLLEATFSWQDICGTVELSTLGVTKGAALAQLLNHLDIDPNDAVAFGDMHNDLDMLRLVGRGYVMADCHPCLLGQGFTQIGAHEDGAVGAQILQLLEVK